MHFVEVTMQIVVLLNIHAFLLNYYDTIILIN